MFSHMVVLGIALCSVFIGQVSFREQFIVLGWNFVHGPYNIYIYIYRERERERERGSSHTWCNSSKITPFLDLKFLKNLMVKNFKNHYNECHL